MNWTPPTPGADAMRAAIPAPPNPGSPAARALGCNCPRSDNNYGLFPLYIDDDGVKQWCIRLDCPVHAPPSPADRVFGPEDDTA